jgi:hypothetical protein
MDPNLSLYRWIASKIEVAEGYGKPDAIPTCANNPGDLELGNRFGLTAVHAGETYTGSIKGVTIFAKCDPDPDIEDPRDGRAALWREVRLILTGRSTAGYKPDWTILQVANKWTRTDPEDWARIVSEGLGVLPSTPLNEIQPPAALSA